MNTILDFFDNLIENLDVDFSWKNSNEEDFFDGYMDERIPFTRVVEDREKCIKFVEASFSAIDDNSQKELLLAVYCNFYIKHGMAGRFELVGKEEEYDGLSHVFAGLHPRDMYLQAVYKAVKYQEYEVWEEILEINKNSIVAKMYKFVKLCHQYGQEAKDADAGVVGIDKYKDMWDLYETIPEPWNQYVIGEGDSIRVSSNYANDLNLLPYLQFISTKEILMEYIPMYYLSILDKLGIEHDIDSEEAYQELFDRLGLRAVENFLKKEMPSKFQGSSQKEMIAVMVECLQKLTELIGNSLEKFSTADEDWDLTFLLEKIHYLQYDEEDEWSDGKDTLAEYTFSEMYIVERLAYLHLPVRVPVKKSLFLSHYNEYLKNRIIKRSARQKKEMMDYYAHSWKHISYPQIVKEIAEELSDSNRVIANRLMKVYNSERTLQRGIQLLQYISSEDEMKVSKEFKNGITKSGVDSAKSIPLSKVILDSLDLVIFKILMVESDDSSSIEKCRQKWCLKKSLDALREEYTEKFLGGISENVQIVDWVNDNFIKMDIDIDADWESVRFKDDSFALNQFKEIMVEIFTNVFLHGEESMMLKFSSNDNEMLICAENPCNDVISGSKSGLSTLERVLEYINFDADIKSIDTKLEDKFVITIRINKRILIRKGR